ncbi:MAG TPA: hypothetical protein VM286_01230 [Candidatus Thermoplasmatota archaeon]|nr:hypothetical protein [Candidatus Thermoplasmatota archaeon]
MILVTCPQLRQEWRIHASRFSKSWLVEMTSRERLFHLEETIHPAIRARIEHLVLDETIKTAMKKDVHLLETAISTDFRVISLERKCREWFIQYCCQIGEVAAIAWANPMRAHDNTTEWIAAGLPHEAWRQLGQTALPL